MQFSKSKVEYASHQLSLYHGECPHGCKYCFVQNYRRRGWKWAVGDLRVNERAWDLAKLASKKDVTCLVVSFTNDPFPQVFDHPQHHYKAYFLYKILSILESRAIPTKVLTKNADIDYLAGAVNPPFEHIQIGLSITTDPLNERVKRKWEPYSSSIEGRLLALANLRDNGFRTWISVEPILPHTDIELLFEHCFQVDSEEIWVGKGNYIKELEQAFDWKAVANQIMTFHYRTKTKIFLKKELQEFLS